MVGRPRAGGDSVAADAVRAQLDRLLGSPLFRHSERLGRFLKFVVEESLAGGTDRLKESVLAIEIFDRETTYDSRVDSVVRVEARRLREKLDKYYATEGQDDPVLIEMPRGAYVPAITWRPVAASRKRRFGTAAQLRYGAIAACLAALVLATVLLTRWADSRGRPPAPSLQRLTSDSGLTFQPALSSGGKLIAYVSDRGGTGSLDIWLQRGPRGVPVRLTDDPGDEVEPAFSPDGALIAYRQEGELDGIYVIPALGGRRTLLARGGYRPRFSPDGSRLAYWTGQRTFRAAKAFIMPAEGGDPVQVQPGFAYAAYPVWSPDGRHVAFVGVRERVTGQPYRDDWDWWVAPVDGGPAVRTLARQVFDRRGLRAPEASWSHRWILPHGWTSSGHIVFSARSGGQTNIWRLAISPRDWRASGTPEQLTFGAGRQDYPAVSEDGVLAFTVLTRKSDVWSLPLGSGGEPAGGLTRLTTGPADSNRPSVSADGSRLAFICNRTGADQVWVQDLATGRAAALTATPGEKDAVAISRDGARVAFGYSPPLRQAILWLPFSGGGATQLCADCGLPRAWMPDGEGILFHRRTPEVSLIEVLDSSGDIRTLASAKDAALVSPYVSPDGRWLAMIVRTPPDDHRVAAAPLRGGKAADRAEWISVSDPGEWVDKPRWSASGDTIYYVSDRDGFVCLWSRRFDPAGGKAAAEPRAVAHFHSARSSLGNVFGMELSAAKDKLVFNLGEASGNIWLAGGGR